jgi:hypothetical protein
MTTNFFHLSLLLLFLDPGSGMGKNQDQGSGINIPDPQPHATVPLTLFVNTHLDDTRLVGEEARAVAQLPVLPLAPTEDPPINSQRHGVLATRVHRHFLYHKLGERAQLARHRDVGAGVAEAEAAVGSLAAGVDLAL